MRQYKERFKDADWAKTPREIIIGGCGGIGSWTAVFLSRIGHNLHLFDNDRVEEVNLGGQCFATRDISDFKTNALADQCRAFSGWENNIETYELYTESSICSPIMFSCFDNMKARKIMFENWKQQEDRELFIDGRLLAEMGTVLVVQKGMEFQYEETLFADEDVNDIPCSYKSTTHSSAIIGGLMVSALNNYLGNKVLGMDIRSIPFKIDYQLPIFNFEIENVIEEFPA